MISNNKNYYYFYFKGIYVVSTYIKYFASPLFHTETFCPGFKFIENIIFCFPYCNYLFEFITVIKI